ncbi:hypothetical protein GGI25_002887 [Coemansia spiralis]|uniref:UFSP1/2/DUB catalytic domain-containing protein n=1 Tax=Coemansia spiralis TaxID=417178 RepID=A0A9W8KX16_9FUNG|nr:peptidase family C78-domain-containing protein [Coemansia spiralis]KAJ2677789.1 hypothetical protein GGI25_002887 [Coemansia spiralis]
MYMVDPADIIDLTGVSGDDSDGMESLEGVKDAKLSEHIKNNSVNIGESKQKSKQTKRRRLQRISDFFRERAINLGHRDDSTRLRVEQLEYTRGDKTIISKSSNGGSNSNSNAAALCTQTQDIASCVVLCNKGTMLFNAAIRDRGWACGYRNCQMLLSSIIASADTSHRTTVNGAASRLPTDRVPSIRALQEMLELAWRDGYDRDGAEQLKHRVTGTRKWIGTTEIYCILAHLGVQAHIVDFHCPTAPDGTHPALFNWVVEYFTDASDENSDPTLIRDVPGNKTTRFVAKHPLYLQHHGHSRTIVGVELAANATNLLVFDPDISIRAHSNSALRLSHFRYRLRDTRGKAQFQILHVDRELALLEGEGAEISKDISSKRVP